MCTFTQISLLEQGLIQLVMSLGVGFPPARLPRRILVLFCKIQLKDSVSRLRGWTLIDFMLSLLREV